jgi:hypothetical protein
VKEQTEAELQLRKLESRLDRARVNGEVEFFEAVLDPGFRTTSPTGSVSDRTQMLKDPATGTLRITASESKDITIRVLGDIAIVTGVAVLKAAYQNHDISGRYAYTHTYVNRDGNWRVVAAHSSRCLPNWVYLLLVRFTNLLRI